MQTCIKIVVHGDGGINKVCDVNLSRSFTFNMNGSYSKGLDNICSISLKIKKKSMHIDIKDVKLILVTEVYSTFLTEE